MRVISIKNYSDDIRVIIQLMQYHNKVSSMSNWVFWKRYQDADTILKIWIFFGKFQTPTIHPNGAIQNPIYLIAGLPSKHSKLGLETRRWCHLSCRTQARFHCSVMLSPRIQYYDGKSVCYAEFQNGNRETSTLKNFHILHPNMLLQSPDTLQWQNDYLQGTGCEMYTETLSPTFTGMTFSQASE